MTPRAELVHWAFAAGFLLLGLILLAEAIVGAEVFAKRRWRAYLWPSLAFALGVLLWPVAVFYTNSTIHMLAHASWAEVAMLGGAVQLALVRGKLTNRWWALSTSVALAVSGPHSCCTSRTRGSSPARRPAPRDRVDASDRSVIPIGQTVRPRRFAWNAGLAMTWIVLAVLLFCDRDLAPIFGHLSAFAGGPE